MAPLTETLGVARMFGVRYRNHHLAFPAHAVPAGPLITLRQYLWHVSSS